MTLTIYFDGQCPLCVREIAFYRKLRGADQIEWIDIARGTGLEVAPGLSRCDAKRRFHLRDEHGRIFSGARAFAKLWSAIPSFRLLGQIAQLPPFVWVLEVLYRFFLVGRPALQKFARMIFSK